MSPMVLYRNTRNMKKQGNMVSQKVNNHTTKDMNDSEGDEISKTELKIMIIMINNNGGDGPNWFILCIDGNVTTKPPDNYDVLIKMF
jgi:hypothetical protein